MSNQIEMESIMTHGSGVFDFWAGWQWSHPKDVKPYIQGQVITPKWCDQYKSTDPVMLDNGAFAAWRDGFTIEENAHVEQVIEAAKKIDPSFIVLPDIVGEGDESFARTKRSAAKIIRSTTTGSAKTDPTLLIAVQEGMRLWDAVEFAELLDGGIFVGGADMSWKRYAVQTIRAKSPGVYIHVGRIWKDGDLCWHSRHAQSFDNTTFSRGQEFNKRIDKVKSLDRYCRRRANPAQTTTESNQ